tara:strand:- start:131 stop:484 length:354 start_codon:yes stop_codon:yes gene_type:complete
MAPQVLETADSRNKFEDLSGVDISAYANPYDALLEACNDDAVSDSVSSSYPGIGPREFYTVLASFHLTIYKSFRHSRRRKADNISGTTADSLRYTPQHSKWAAEREAALTRVLRVDH